MIPNLKSLIEPLTTRFPSAWAKCKAPHDDGEFNARVCAVLYYEQGLTNVGRNGKRGDPKVLSKDVICWRGYGPNYDPTNGNAPVTIIDFIGAHEAPNAYITQITPDPNGPGAWVKPLTLAEIDGGQPNPIPPPHVCPPAPPTFPYPDENTSVRAFQDRVKKAYNDAGRPFPDPNDSDAFRRFTRYGYDCRSNPESEMADKHIRELRAELGVPPLS